MNNDRLMPTATPTTPIKKRRTSMAKLIMMNAPKTEAPLTAAESEFLLEIAKRMFFIETLETRGCDRLDFHDVGVASMKEALEAACRAGVRIGRAKKETA